MSPFPSFGGALISSMAWLLLPLGIIGYALVSQQFRQGAAGLLSRSVGYFTGPTHRTVSGSKSDGAPTPTSDKLVVDEDEDEDWSAWNAT